MGFIKRMLGMESCMGFFTYPFGMKRKEKAEALEGMIELIKKSSKKRNCDICKRKFNKEMSRWSKDDFTSSICILCHSKFWNKRIKDYMPEEQKEIRQLKRGGKR